MLEIKDSTFKRIRYKLNKIFNIYDEPEIIQKVVVRGFVELIVSKPSWAIQHISYLTFKYFKELYKDNFMSMNQRDEAQWGLDVLNDCEGIFYDIKIGYSPETNTATGSLIPKVVLEQDIEENSIELREQPTDRLEVECSKRFWNVKYKAVEGIEDTLKYLANQKYKLNNYILDNYTDDSYKDSMYPELELNRANKMYQKFRNKDIYFDWFIDARGRIYSKGYHINVQGTKYKKASLDMVTNKISDGFIKHLKDELNIK